MARGDAIEVEGAVVQVLPHGVYWVELPNGHRVLAHWRGKARRNPVALAAGDRVRLEMTPFDLSKGAIIWNEKQV
ncbi:MAG TPA: translation initiation factor IF-1 [Verrucomicrobiae bacterium]|nr:translation initiation factor IF-1 [Verrucomicrobiae bacterium]